MPDHFPLTRVLARDVAGGSRTKGRLYHLDGAVTGIEGSPWSARATVQGGREYRVTIERDGDDFTASCECAYFVDRGTVCKHIWAALLEAERRGLLTGEGTIGPDARVGALHQDSAVDPEFAPSRAGRLAAAAHPTPP